MDLPGVLARAPEVCLIDELATQRPVFKHPKRYEDIADVLAADIDVLSTLNVQHLESLNDQVAELTGTRVGDVLNAILATADEVVLVDLTPEALIGRGGCGRGVRARARRGRAQQLLQGREPGRAARGGAARGGRGGRGEAPGPGAAGRPRGAAVRGTVFFAGPGSGASARPDRPVASSPTRATPGLALRPAARRRARPALRTRPVLDPSAESARASRDVAAPSSVLGAHLMVEEGDDLAEVAARVARERGTTYVLLGAPRPRRGLARLSEPLLMRLVRRLPGVDVRVVADRGRGTAGGGGPAGFRPLHARRFTPLTPDVALRRRALLAPRRGAPPRRRRDRGDGRHRPHADRARRGRVPHPARRGDRGALAVEVGTFTGYSAICIARGLAPGGGSCAASSTRATRRPRGRT